MTVLIVTGTGTGVGKTVVTAALAACAAGSVAVVKPAQTGLGPDEPGDLAEVTRLSGVSAVFEFARFPDPLSPDRAALMSGLPALDRGEAVRRIIDLDDQFDLVIVEGAGGLLVPFDRDGWTLVELARELDAPLLVVTQAGLGTLNHTALTLRTIEEESLRLAGIVIGSWPADAGLAERCNVHDLARLAPRLELVGVLPAGMSTVRDFPERACKGLAPRLGGTFDWPAFATGSFQARSL